MKRRILTLLVTLLLIFGLTTNAFAQSYSFVVPTETVQVYWNSDGTLSLDYLITFQNDAGGHIIDYVDLGLPSGNYDFNSITADINGHTLEISRDFQGDGLYGISVVMGQYAIPAGSTGTVHVAVGKITGMFFPDSNDQTLTSGEFAPAYWSTAHGSTFLTVSFHLPQGVQTTEPRYHTPSSNWPGDQAPQSSLDAQGRITYTWQSQQADASSQFTFGMSVPRTYLPADAISSPPVGGTQGIDWSSIGSNLFSWGICCFFIFIFIGSPILGVINERKRKMQYLPPKISIEGHGIKRGLTAVEASILMEQPLDKIMTMILFGVIKKGAATVVTRDPLSLKLTDPQPADLHDYEKDFLKAFANPAVEPKAGLQTMTINLIKSVGDKMKGFSGKESIEYYKAIMEKAWNQIEAAGTPEVKSELFEQSLEWTMLDKDYDNRTRRVFSGPVYVPMWWGNYDPGYHSAGLPKASPGVPAMSSGRSTTTIPGASFAASVVTGVQNFSGRVLGNLGGFTSRVTNATNPVPVVKSSYKGSSGGGGHSCACACACAGCACACAGGGR